MTSPKKNILLLLLVLLIVSACSGTQPQGIDYQSFRTGISELSMTFLPQLPPEKIYPQSDVAMLLQLHNKAGYDIINGKVAIVGADARYLEITALEQSFARLEGRSLENAAGELTQLRFDARAKDLTDKAASQVVKYIVALSYQSSLEFVDTVCLDPRLYQLQDSGCTMQPLKQYSGQGSPLAVVRLEEIMHPGSSAKVELRLHLEARGKGKVIAIRLGQAKLGGEELECHIQGTEDLEVKVHAANQKVVVICHKGISSSVSYQTPISVEFGYDYELREPHQVTLVGSTNAGILS